ncbi:MAG: pyridoxal phosphate-dependent aminotransferase [Lentisphaeria bacterium]|nr:pyridoxal phosphate-dependent aminotransferase [Lentisphaeria bacterium]
MQLVTPQIENYLANASGIRKMFEAGIELKKKYGADKVYDFSLGNPDLPPPPQVAEALQRIAVRTSEPFSIGYMPNAGYPELRAKLAERLSAEQNCTIPAANTLLTVGAAGGINVLFRTILQPGDEVITPSPYFVEYGFYAGNFGGKLVPVPSKDFTFELDVPAMAAAITGKTRAIILNSPHNPTGAIYTRAQLAELGNAVRDAESRYGKPIYIVADEPYRFLNFDGVEIPSLFEFFLHSVVIGSYSKSLSLAGERIGYIAVNPAIPEVEKLMGGLILCNRILGYVNAPALAQQVLLECLDAQVDLEIYRRRRAAMAEVLDYAGIRYQMPKGAFYFFPQSPVPDEREFVAALLEEQILAVPGRSFGKEGYIRMAFCVDETVIRNAAEGMKRAVAKISR